MPGSREPLELIERVAKQESLLVYVWHYNDLNTVPTEKGGRAHCLKEFLYASQGEILQILQCIGGSRVPSGFYTVSLKEDTSEADFHTLVGRVVDALHAKRRSPELLQELKKGIKRFPTEEGFMALANVYHTGQGEKEYRPESEETYREEVKWLEEGAARGFVQAWLRLGRSLIVGEGTLVDFERGCEYLQKAARQGDPEGKRLHSLALKIRGSSCEAPAQPSASGFKEPRAKDLNLEQVGAEALPWWLKDPKVQDLNLKWVSIGDKEVLDLDNWLGKSCVQNLNLEGRGIGDAGARALAAGLQGSQVQNLNLVHNGIGPAGAEALAASLKGSLVQNLNLGHNALIAAGVQILATCLRVSQVQDLNLEWNSIGDAGAEVLSTGLKGSRVQSLNLGNNGLAASGARALAAGLQGSQVQNLNLDGNQIGDAGTQALAVGLKGSRVQSLSLDGNQMGLAGVQALAASLKDSRVQSLSLGHNGIGDGEPRLWLPFLKTFMCKI